MAVNRDLIGQADRFDHADRVVLDMDCSESPVHGQQEGSAYNGHFESVCYHPLFLFNDHGDCLAAKLRPGNIASADDWDDLLLPEIERRQAARKRVAFRADAAFARPAIYEALETRGVGYAIRIPANRNLELAVEDILFAHRDGRASSRSSATRVFSIRRTPGRRPDGLWRRSSTTSASCSRAWASSSRISCSPIARSCASITSGAPPSSGSRRGSRRRTGRGCRVIASWPTRPGCSCAYSPTTWGTSGGGWCSPRGSTPGR